MTLDELLDILAERRGTDRLGARAVLAIMPGGQELLSGHVSPDDSLLAQELANPPDP